MPLKGDRAAIRRNAVAIALWADKGSPELGGHIASIQSRGRLVILYLLVV